MIVRLILTALAVYVLYAGLLFSLQRRVLYPGAGAGLGPLSWSGEHPPETEALSLRTSGGEVEAWIYYLPWTPTQLDRMDVRDIARRLEDVASEAETLGASILGLSARSAAIASAIAANTGPESGFSSMTSRHQLSPSS